MDNTDGAPDIPPSSPESGTSASSHEDFEPVTSEPETSEPVTSEPVTSEPVTSEPITSEPEAAAESAVELESALRDLADVPAVEVVTTVAVHLMSAAAIRCGLAEEGEAAKDLDEARTLINALAALVVASAPDLGSAHAAPLRDGLRSLQLAFREASAYPDAPGKGPGEKYTGPVLPTAGSGGGA